MKIGITGGSGFIGSYLARAAVERGDEAIIFSRKTFLPSTLKNRPGISLVTTQIPLPQDLEKLDVLVNLAGESVIGGRWTEERKAALRFSRVEYTNELIRNLKITNKKPLIFIGGSAIGYYGMHPDGKDIFTEKSGPGNDFLAQLCVDWELKSLEVESSLGIRTCIARTGIVLSPESGALAQMLPPFKAFVGGPIGTGKQFMSWIHIKDMVQGILFLIENGSARGVFNFTAPQPVDNQEFSKTLARCINRPCVFKVPGLALELLYGEGAQVILRGQNVVPNRLREIGYKFYFSELESSLRDLLN